MTYFRKPSDLATMNWNLNGTLNAKIIVALSLPESFLWIRPTQQFKASTALTLIPNQNTWLNNLVKGNEIFSLLDKIYCCCNLFENKLILNTSYHSYHGWRSSDKKQTISAFKIIVNQAFVTCYLAESIWKMAANVNNCKTKLTE